MPQATLAKETADKDWKFLNVGDGWMWEHRTSKGKGGVIAVGLFANLAQCISDAKHFAAKLSKNVSGEILDLAPDLVTWDVDQEPPALRNLSRPDMKTF